VVRCPPAGPRGLGPHGRPPNWATRHPHERSAGLEPALFQGGNLVDYQLSNDRMAERAGVEPATPSGVSRFERGELAAYSASPWMVG